MIALIFAVILLGGVAVVEFGMGERNKPPHIFLIVWDTVRSDHVALSDSAARDTTPFLRELASQGMVFTHARSPAPWTLPAHASIFTGRLPSEHNCHFEHRYLVDDAVTIAEVLSERGYATAGFSSNVNVSRLYNVAQGFDQFYETWTDPRIADLGEDPSDVLMEEVEAWLANEVTRPRFVFINLMDAHLPYRPQENFKGRFGDHRPDVDDVLGAPDFLDAVLAGEVALDDRMRTTLVDRYDSAIRGLDERLRGFVARLGELEMDQESVLIVTSDHGENLGDHGLVDHQGTLHDTVLRVPLVIHGAGVPAGEVIHEPTSTGVLFRWIQSIAERRFRRPSVPTEVISERMASVSVLERLAASRPDVDRSPFARREVGLAVAPRAWKIVRGDDGTLRGAPIAGRPGDETVEDVDDPRTAELADQLDRLLARRRTIEERIEPEPPSGAVDEALEELRRLGYATSTRTPAGFSVHAQEHLNRGNRAFQREAYDEAREEYEIATRLSPGFGPAWFNLAIVAEKISPDDALAAWNRYVEVAMRAAVQDDASLDQAYRRIEALSGS